MRRQEEEKRVNAQGNHAMSLKEKRVEVRTSDGKWKEAMRRVDE